MTKHFFINEGCHSSMKKQQINCFIKAYVSTWNIIIFKPWLSTRHYLQTRNRCENLDLAGRNVIFGIIVNTFKFSSRNTLVYLSSRHLALVCKPVLCFFVFFFGNWDSLHSRLNSHYEAWSYKKKKHEKITAYRKSV